MATYFKPAQSIAEQIALLRSRGLVIADDALAERALRFVSYYRLRAYWLHFEADPANGSHHLRAGTTLRQVLDLYEFDRELRLLVLDAIERIEVASRGVWAYQLATRHGSHGYLKPSLYPDRGQFDANYRALLDEVSRSHDAFIAHYKRSYDDPLMPPVWMSAELMSFGLLSKWQSALGAVADRKEIAKPFGLGEKAYFSFIHHLSTIRNICAHHGRLWNRSFAVSPVLPSRPAELASSLAQNASRTLYNTLTITIHVLTQIDPEQKLGSRFTELLERHPSDDLAAMGFPSDWQKRAIWATSALEDRATL